MRTFRTANALCGIALGLSLTSPLLAQESGAPQPDAGSEGECSIRSAHECAERCPSFETCYIAEGGGQLYYRVGDQRFDCAALDCGAANQELGDYCCERGEYAPSAREGSDGCALVGSVARSRSSSAGARFGLAAWLTGTLAFALWRRREA